MNDDHPVYDAVHGLRNASEETQERYRRELDTSIDKIRESEDEEWTRLANAEFASHFPEALKNVYAFSDTKSLTLASATKFWVNSTKALEAKRYAPSRSRVGNAVPLNKSKALNRKKAKAAKAARKAQR